MRQFCILAAEIRVIDIKGGGGGLGEGATDTRRGALPLKHSDRQNTCVGILIILFGP